MSKRIEFWVSSGSSQDFGKVVWHYNGYSFDLAKKQYDFWLIHGDSNVYIWFEKTSLEGLVNVCLPTKCKGIPIIQKQRFEQLKLF